MASNNYKEQISAWFASHKDEMIADLAKLVSVKSISAAPVGDMPFGEGSYNALMTAKEIIESKGFNANIHGNAVLSADLNDNELQLAMLAHVDVVPEGVGWSTDPYTLVEKDGVLYGRGVSDDKGPAIAAFYAMVAAREIAPELTKNCRLILGSSEETGMGDLHFYEKDAEYPPLVFSPDADFPLINIEKGKFGPDFYCDWIESKTLPRIVHAQGGSVTNIVPRAADAIVEGLTAADVKPVCDAVSKEYNAEITCRDTNNGVLITTYGVAAHASVPTNGLNANTVLISVLTRLPIAECEGFCRLKKLSELIPHGDCAGCALGINCKDEVSGEITVNFGIFKFDLHGMYGNLDIRTPVCADNMPIAKMTEAAFRKAGINCNTESILPSHFVPADSEFVQTLLGIYEDYTGLKGEAIAIGGLTYAHDIPGAVAFGCSFPGRDAGIHGINENFLVDELITSAEIFTQAIIVLCK